MIFVGVFQFAILLVALVRGKGLALLLGPEGVGVVGTIDQLVVTIYQISALGLPFTAMKFMSAAHSRSRGEYLRTFAAFGRILFGLSFIASFLSIGIFLIWPGILGPELVRYGVVVPIALIGIPHLAATIFLSRALSAAGRSRAAAGFGLVSSVLLMIATLAGVALNGLTGLYLTYTSIGFAVGIAGLAYFRRTSGLSLFRRNIAMRKIFSSGPRVGHVALSVYSVLVGYSANLLIVRYAVLQQMGDVSAGLLQAVLAISLSAGSIMAAISSLHLAPYLNRSAPLADKVAAAHGFARRVGLFFLVAAVPVALFPGLILSLLFSREFQPAASALVLGLVWQCLYQIVNVYQQLLVGVNRLRAMAILIGLGFLISALLAVLLVDDLGLMAAPLALIAGSLFSVVGMMIYLRRAGLTDFPLPVLGTVATACLFILAAGGIFSAVSEQTTSGLFLRGLVVSFAIATAWAFTAKTDRSALINWVLGR